MDQAAHNKIVSFIWGIADDVLRDLFERGKYRDVILPMCVLRRLDAVLEPTKKQVLETKAMLDKAGITEQHAALCKAAGQAFYNTSKFSLRDLKSRGQPAAAQGRLRGLPRRLLAERPGHPDNFEFRNSPHPLSKTDALGTLIEKFLDPEINLSPNPVLNGDGSVKHPAMDNHSMGTVFEELVRRFNEENNEEAGEHWTPRDAVRLMATLIFLPIADQIEVRLVPALRRRLRYRRHADRGRGDAAAARRRAQARRWSRTSTGRRSTPRPTPSARPTCC